MGEGSLLRCNMLRAAQCDGRRACEMDRAISLKMLILIYGLVCGRAD